MVDDKTIERWIEMKDQIPNLQMMEERKNRVKVGKSKELTFLKHHITEKILEKLDLINLY